MQVGFNRICPKCNINVIKNHKGQQCRDCYQKSRKKGYCFTCNKKLRHSHTQYCMSCFAKSRKGEKSESWKGGLPNCIKCGNKLSVYKNSTQYNTGICQKCYRGKLSHRWKWSLSDEERESSKGRMYQPAQLEWRRKVYERDKYTCQKCGYRGEGLCSHHIENYAHNKEKRNDINNGITLCTPCHLAFHKKYGFFYSNKEQLYDFLKTYQIQ